MNKLRLTGLLLTRLLGLLLVYVSCVQVGYAQQSGGGNYPTGNGVRVREVDGSPNVPGTQTLVFPNGSLTRAGQTVTVTFAGSGSSPGGSGSQVQYRVDATTFGGLTGSSVSGANLALGGTLTVPGTVGAGGSGATSAHTLTSNISAGNAVEIRNLSASGYSSTRILDSGGTERMVFGYGNSSAVYYTSASYIISANSTPLVFGVGTSEKIRLHASGNFSIGNTTDALPLYVSGNVAFNTSSVTYQTTNGGGNNTQRFAIAPLVGAGRWGIDFNESSATAQDVAFNFSVSNSSSNVVRTAAIIANGTRTAGSETGVLNFHTKPSSGAGRTVGKFDETGLFTANYNLRINSASDGSTHTFSLGNTFVLAGPDTANLYTDTSGEPSATQAEHLIRANGVYNALSLQNLSNGGYSAVRFNSDAGKEYFAVGYGNSGAGAAFAGKAYVEHSAPVSVGTPVDLVFVRSVIGSSNTIHTTVKGASGNWVHSADVGFDSSSKGLILKSPGGTCYRISVDNSGVLSTASVTCP